MSQSLDDETTRVFVRQEAATRLGDRPGGRTGLWCAEDVASFLQVSRSWVYGKAESGLLPVIRMPGSSLLRFEPEVIRAYARGEWTPPKAAPVQAAKARK